MGTAFEANDDLTQKIGQNETAPKQDGWLAKFASGFYTDARDAVKNPYVIGTGAAVLLGTAAIAMVSPRTAAAAAEAALPEIESAVAPEAAGLTAAATGDSTAIASTLLRESGAGIETPTVNGTKFIFREGLPPNWVGRDGASYAYKGAPVTNESWRGIYESEFPADEQQPYSFLESLAAKDSVPKVSLQLTERDGKTAAFSMISDYGEGTEGKQLLLPYIAVEKDLQNMGVGSAHLERLVAQAKELFPTARGMAIEVEDPNAAGISAEALAQRTQRVNWYVNHHGAELLDRKYLIPSAEDGADALPGRLLWLDFNRGGASESSLHQLISSIYKHGYGLEENNAVVSEVLGKYSGI